MAVIDCWPLGTSSCPNKSGQCFIIETVHLKLLAANLKSRSMAIIEGSADIDTAPETPITTFMPAKRNTKNPFRDPVKKSLEGEVLTGSLKGFFVLLLAGIKDLSSAPGAVYIYIQFVVLLKLLNMFISSFVALKSVLIK
jgi:hypothetical protein